MNTYAPKVKKITTIKAIVAWNKKKNHRCRSQLVSDAFFIHRDSCMPFLLAVDEQIKNAFLNWFNAFFTNNSIHSKSCVGMGIKVILQYDNSFYRFPLYTIYALYIVFRFVWLTLNMTRNASDVIMCSFH